MKLVNGGNAGKEKTWGC